MSQPVLKTEPNWSQPSNVASTRDAIITALKETTNEGPGDFLKQLREIAKLELTEVAAQLGLNKDQVEALENNDYSHLPAPIYVKGFYRRYCTLLSVPVEPVIHAYEQSSRQHNPELGRVTLTQRNKHFSFRYIQYGLVLVILLIVIYSLQSVDFTSLWNTVHSGDSNKVVKNSANLALPDVKETPVEDTPSHKK